jgi:CubicO group peptidase (beta-lactamase class C family)
MIERVNNNQPLGSYMQDHIWKPLGMTSTSFRLQERPDIKSRRADMSMRAADGSVEPSPTRYFPEDCPDDHGGGGVYSCMADYIKLLIALLRNDGTLLKPATMDTLFAPCLSSAAAKRLQDDWSVTKQESEEDDINIKVPAEVDYSLGGMVSRVDVYGGRSAGSMWWGGLPNLSWVLDRKAGIALLYGSQLLPPQDKVSKQVVRMFEGAVYGGEHQLRPPAA